MGSDIVISGICLTESDVAEISSSSPTQQIPLVEAILRLTRLAESIEQELPASDAAELLYCIFELENAADNYARSVDSEILGIKL